MDISPLDLVCGLALSAVIAGLAYKKGSLSPSGLLAAICLGTLIYILGGPLWWSILIFFFISSSLLSKFKRKRKAQVEQDFAKDGCRDWIQVLANGAVALTFAIAYSVIGHSAIKVAYIASLATVNADTWATEIGILSPRPPVSILTFKPLTTGASGAISLLGSTAAMLGAIALVLVATLGLLLSQTEVNLLLLTIAASLGGIFGCLVDSLLGATIQAMYKCPVCGKVTERKQHHGQATILVRGSPVFPNDMVNLSSSLLGGLGAMAIFIVFT